MLSFLLLFLINGINAINNNDSKANRSSDFDTQPFGNTLNGCFYSKNTGISGGNLITSIEISGGLDINLSQCCEKCRGIPTCIIWYFNNSICYFYNSFSTLFITNVTTFVGIRTNTQLVNCKQETGKFYYDTNLNWEIQLASSSKFSVTGCCHDCFWSKGTVNGCKSYMFNEISRDCYHTEKSFVGTAFVESKAIITGESSLINLQDYESESINTSKESSLSLYIIIGVPCGILLLLISIFLLVFFKKKNGIHPEMEKLKREKEILEDHNLAIQFQLIENDETYNRNRNPYMSNIL